MTDYGMITITIKQLQPLVFPDNWPDRDELEGRLAFLLSMMGNNGYRVFDVQLSREERRAIRAWLIMRCMTSGLRRFSAVIVPGFVSACNNAGLAMVEFRKAIERMKG